MNKQQTTNLNRYVCEVASVDEVSRSVDVVEQTVECLHVWIASGTTMTDRCHSIITVHLNTQTYHFTAPPSTMLISSTLILLPVIRHTY